MKGPHRPRVQVLAWSAGGFTFAMLDQGRPRVLGRQAIKLTDLMLEEEEPAPGEHSLLACRFEDRGGEASSFLAPSFLDPSFDNWGRADPAPRGPSSEAGAAATGGAGLALPAAEPGPGLERARFSCHELRFVLGARGELTEQLEGPSGRCFLLEPGGTYYTGATVPFLALRSPSPGESAGPLRLEIADGRGQAEHFDVVPGRRDRLTLSAGDFELALECPMSDGVSRVITLNPEWEAE